MTQVLDESTIVQGKGKYYILNGYNYDIHFPFEWAVNTEGLFGNVEIIPTGPENCANCYFHGSRNGVFIGYCHNCGVHLHKSNRNFLVYDAKSITTNERLWEELPYMSGVNINDIGIDTHIKSTGCANSISDIPDEYLDDGDDYDYDANEDEDYDSEGNRIIWGHSVPKYKKG
jgi:hypothetical protein